MRNIYIFFLKIFDYQVYDFYLEKIFLIYCYFQLLIKKITAFDLEV